MILDEDHVVLAGIPNHSFLSPQALEGEVFDDDLDDDNDDNNDDDDNDNDDDGHFGMEYNAMMLCYLKILCLNIICK